MRTLSADGTLLARHGTCSQSSWFRLPETLFPRLRPQVVNLAKQAAGERVRFCTDAKQIFVRIQLNRTAIKTHMTPLNMAGAELFAQGENGYRRAAILRPKALGDVPFEKLDGYSLSDEIAYTISLGGELLTYTLYLPSFTEVGDVSVSFPDEARVLSAKPYTVAKPIVFYGSSITQGACAGRPSLTWPARVCAALDADYINLGFAGNALGEAEIAAYIAALPMSCFVLDYDHNAPTTEHLRNTHASFYRIVRNAQPELPILFVSRPGDGKNREETDERYQVIHDTYEAALKQGDTHVTLLDGRTFFPQGGEDECLMDFVHPNDFGFACIAEKALPVLRQLVK